MPSSLYFSYLKFFGGLAQLARAPALQAGGQRFESVILHDSKLWKAIFDMMHTHKLLSERDFRY